jgi:hypothetical protein
LLVSTIVATQTSLSTKVDSQEIDKDKEKELKELITHALTALTNLARSGSSCFV